MLEAVIEGEQKAIRVLLMFCLAFIVIGLGTSAGTYILLNASLSDSSRLILSLAGVLVSSGSSFLLKDVPEKRRKIIVLKHVSVQYQQLADYQVPWDDPKVKELNDLVDPMVR